MAEHVREPSTWEEEAGLGAQGYAVTLKVVWVTWDPVLKYKRKRTTGSYECIFFLPHIVDMAH